MMLRCASCPSFTDLDRKSRWSISIASTVPLFSAKSADCLVASSVPDVYACPLPVPVECDQSVPVNGFVPRQRSMELVEEWQHEEEEEPQLPLVAFEPFLPPDFGSRRSSETPELPAIVEEEQPSEQSTSASSSAIADEDEETNEEESDQATARAPAGSDPVEMEPERKDSRSLADKRSLSQGDQNSDVNNRLRLSSGRGSIDTTRSCQSQILENHELSDFELVDVSQLEKSLSTSTPSMDSIGLPPVEKKEKDTSSRSGSVKSAKDKSISASKVPPFIAPHQVVMMQSSKPPNRSYSSVGKERDTKEKLVRSQTGSSKGGSLFGRFRPGSTKSKGDWRKKGLYVKDRSESEHNFISVSCSNYSSLCDQCDKKLMRSPSSGQAMRCSNCDMLIHVHCTEQAGSCTVRKHPHDLLKHKNGENHSPTAWSSATDLRLQPGVVPTTSSSGYLSISGDDVTVRQYPALVLPAWADLDLWSNEPEAWSLAHRDKTKSLHKKEVKRQDIIYELYSTEKHHCETLVVLKQIHWELLANSGFVSKKELNQLIPNVFEELLEFHLEFFRQLKQRKDSAIVVGDISDILDENFGPKNERRRPAVASYVEFCSSKEEANKFYHRMMAENSKFHSLMNFLSSNPLYKERTLPDCLLLITQRLTKYPVLVDQLLKQETHSSNKEKCAAAAATVKLMTREVDCGLATAELKKRWAWIQDRLEPVSTCTLHGKRFTMKDLTHFPNRQVRCSGTVLWQNAARKPVDVELLLFDDIIVFLTINGGRYSFFSQDKHESVLSLTNLLIREKAGKGHAAGLLLIVVAPQPDMYEILFRTKQELRTWHKVLEEAQTNRVPVRRLRETDIPVESESNVDDLDVWLEEFKTLFASRSSEEQKLKDYLIGRLEWFDQIRTKLKCMPQRGRTDLKERVVEILKTELGTIRSNRLTALAECIHKAEESEDQWLPSPFDDAWDAGVELIEELEVNGVIRRHTTVPKIHEEDLEQPEEDNVNVQEQTEETQRPRASTKLRQTIDWYIRENAELRRQNNAFRTELTSQAAELALAKERNKPATTETLERLRQAQSELQQMQIKFSRENDDKQRRMEELEARLSERQGQVESGEQELAHKWQAYYDKYNVTPNQSATSFASSTPLSIDKNAHNTLDFPLPSASFSFNDSALQTSNSMSDVMSPSPLVNPALKPSVQSSSSLPSSKSVPDFDSRPRGSAPDHLMGIVNEAHRGSEPPKQQIPKIGTPKTKGHKERRPSASPKPTSRLLLPSGHQQFFPNKLAQSSKTKNKKK